MREREKTLFAEGCWFCKLSVSAVGLSQPHSPAPMLYALTAGRQKQLTSKWSEDKRLA